MVPVVRIDKMLEGHISEIFEGEGMNWFFQTTNVLNNLSIPNEVHDD